MFVCVRAKSPGSAGARRTCELRLLRPAGEGQRVVMENPRFLSGRLRSRPIQMCETAIRLHRHQREDVVLSRAAHCV